MGSVLIALRWCNQAREAGAMAGPGRLKRRSPWWRILTATLLAVQAARIPLVMRYVAVAKQTSNPNAHCFGLSQ